MTGFPYKYMYIQYVCTTLFPASMEKDKRRWPGHVCACVCVCVCVCYVLINEYTSTNGLGTNPLGYVYIVTCVPILTVSIYFSR